LDEAVKARDVVLKKSPSDLDGHLLRGRVHLAKRETTDALQEFQKVLKAEPRLAPVRHQLALAHPQAGSPQQAKTELKEAVTIAPRFADAVLLLAEINIQVTRRGRYAGAVIRGWASADSRAPRSRSPMGPPDWAITRA